ncbi:unnamed protein product [Haemonchus placei]|uniref:KxDL domain-containing protein n=1 Tax=Haemonchus placei TaxID=6290 RepID=A0A0N4X639_HAEPC|nr:unnamed protein product [Haemonchus placei]
MLLKIWKFSLVEVTPHFVGLADQGDRTKAQVLPRPDDESDERCTNVISGTTPFMEDVRSRLERIENNTSDITKPSDLNDANAALAIRWDEIHQDVQRTKELLELHNSQKRSFEINLLQGRLDAMKANLQHSLLPTSLVPRGAHST